MNARDRLSVIEVGTKGIRLLIAERRDPPEGMAVLRTAGQLGMLGEGITAAGGVIRRENLHRSLASVHQFLDESRQAGVREILVAGTEVFRRAANVVDFTAELPFDVTLRVLRPEEEAVGSFLSAAWGFRRIAPPGSRLLLVDLGGGSLEVIAGCQGNPPQARAGIFVPAMGTLALRGIWRQANLTAHRDPLLQQHITESLAGQPWNMVRSPNEGTKHFVAGLGSTIIDSAWILRYGSRARFSSRKVHGARARVADLERLRHRLLVSRWRGKGGLMEELELKDPLGHQLGLAAVLEVLRQIGAQTITACGTGLRFGLAYAALHGIPLGLKRIGAGTTE